MRRSLVCKARLVAALGALLISGSCASVSHSVHWIDMTPPMTVDGVPVEPTKDLVIRNWLGQPSFVIPINDGELCVWRKPRSDEKAGHEDTVVKFDREGRFLPLDRVPDEVATGAPCSCFARKKG